MHTVIPITTEEIRDLFFADALPAEEEFPDVPATVILMDSSDDQFLKLHENLFCWTHEPLSRSSCCMWFSLKRRGAVVLDAGEICLFVFASEDAFERGVDLIRQQLAA